MSRQKPGPHDTIHLIRSEQLVGTTDMVGVGVAQIKRSISSPSGTTERTPTKVRPERPAS